MDGFFAPTVQKPAQALFPRCGACGLSTSCQSPKFPVAGDGGRGILLVGSAPDRIEDSQGALFSGPSGTLIRSLLMDLGVDADRDCWMTHALICHPAEDRVPDPKEIDYCRPNLTNAIQRLKPRVIVPFGLPAVRSVIGPLFREDVGSMFRWAGFRIPLRRYNAWILPTFSPLSLLEKGDTKSGPALRVWFERHLQDAATVEGTPWPDGPPDYVSQVHIEMNPEHAAAWIRDHMRRGGGCSFDYETNDTKPDRNGARIVSCAVCWRGRETIAFPWVGAVIPAMREFLSSDVPKIGANCKFEDRWTMREFGFPVRNWQWDCMLSAHHLDNRRGITGAKFQAFVRLGLEPWNVEVERFFSATDPETGFNQIDRIDLRALLRYNGIDAVVEYYLANAQRREMNAGRLFDA